MLRKSLVNTSIFTLCNWSSSKNKIIQADFSCFLRLEKLIYIRTEKFGFEELELAIHKSVGKGGATLESTAHFPESLISQEISSAPLAMVQFA